MFSLYYFISVYFIWDVMSLSSDDRNHKLLDDLLGLTFLSKILIFCWENIYSLVFLFILYVNGRSKNFSFILKYFRAWFPAPPPIALWSLAVCFVSVNLLFFMWKIEVKSVQFLFLMYSVQKENRVDAQTM